jgi:hypothetical protein
MPFRWGSDRPNKTADKGAPHLAPQSPPVRQPGPRRPPSRTARAADTQTALDDGLIGKRSCGGTMGQRRRPPRLATNTHPGAPSRKARQSSSTATGSRPVGVTAFGSRRVSSTAPFSPRRIQRSNGSTNPLVGRSNSAGSRPALTDTPEHGLPAERLIARPIRQPVHALEQQLVR